MQGARKRAASAALQEPALALSAAQRDCVELVRATFLDRPDVFGDFVEIVSEYERRALDAAGAIRRVARLFRAGNRSLVLKFNLFLPKSEHITEANLYEADHPAFLLPPNSNAAVKRARVEKDHSHVLPPQGTKMNLDGLLVRMEPIYSLLYPDAPAPTVAAMPTAATSAAAVAREGDVANELPRLVLPGDRVMVDLNDSSVHKDSELNGGLPDLRHPEMGRLRDSAALEQLLLDHVMAERFSRRAEQRATATGNASNEATDVQLAANQERAGPRWEPAVVLGSSRDMLALNTYSGDKIYVINPRMKPRKAFNDVLTIHTCHSCRSRMRVPRPCDVLVCFQCKTKIKPPLPPLESSFSARGSSRHGTELPLRAIAPMSPGDFVGRLRPADEVEVQVVYKHAHRASGRAWVMAKVIGRAKWAGAADVLQLMVPYPTPNDATLQSAGVAAPRGGFRDDWRDFSVSSAQTRLARADGASGTRTTSETADPQPTLELPAGNRFGSATVELPSIDTIPSADKMPDPVPILVSTDLTPLSERAVQCQRIARDRPHDLAERHILVSDPPSLSGMPGTSSASDGTAMMRVRSMRTAVVLSFVPGLQRHVVAYSEQEVKLIDLTTACFILEPSTTRIYHASVLAKPGTHIKDCPVCFEPFDWSSLGRISMSCHPRECCSDCLSAWADGQISEGKLYVRCPAEGCKKQLALSQVKQVVNRSKFNSFVSSIREVHREAARAEHQELSTGTAEEQKAFREWVKEMDVRFCIGCFARIEKNKGCNHMTCWRCGTEFQWESAPPVSDGLPEVQAAANGGRGANADGSTSLSSRPRMPWARQHHRSASAVSGASSPVPVNSAAAASSSSLSLFVFSDDEEDGMINAVQRRSRRTTLQQPQRPKLALPDLASLVAAANNRQAPTAESTSSVSAPSGVDRSPSTRTVSSPQSKKRQCSMSQPRETSSLHDGSPRRSSRTAAADAVAPSAEELGETSPKRYTTRASRQKHVAAATPVVATQPQQ